MDTWSNDVHEKSAGELIYEQSYAIPRKDLLERLFTVEQRRRQPAPNDAEGLSAELDRPGGGAQRPCKVAGSTSMQRPPMSIQPKPRMNHIQTSRAQLAATDPLPRRLVMDSPLPRRLVMNSPRPAPTHHRLSPPPQPCTPMPTLPQSAAPATPPGSLGEEPSSSLPSQHPIASSPPSLPLEHPASSSPPSQSTFRSSRSQRSASPQAEHHHFTSSLQQPPSPRNQQRGLLSESFTRGEATRGEPALQCEGSALCCAAHASPLWATRLTQLTRKVGADAEATQTRLEEQSERDATHHLEMIERAQRCQRLAVLTAASKKRVEKVSSLLQEALAIDESVEQSEQKLLELRNLQKQY
mmetsp:Transcript_51216/g.84943  ORF Transcript_51216/g.84943 Transcript_51216/m.84943 type:complete len:355 (-) Transcript_51216:13-1077(-)